MNAEMVRRMKVGLIAMTIVLMGCLAYSYIATRPNDACEPTIGQLSVDVKDTYGNALRNVNITVWWGPMASRVLIRTGLTDSNGKINFEHLNFEWYNITATKGSCQPAFSYSKFDANHLKRTFTLSYRTYNVAVNVSQATSSLPLENANVLLYRYDYSEHYQSDLELTNASGIAYFPNQEYDEYALSITCGGYYNQSLLVFVNASYWINIALEEIFVPYPKVYLIMNVTTYSLGTPLEGANVVINGYNYLDNYVIITQATNASGLTTFDLEHGDYVVTIFRSGYLNYSIPLLHVNASQLLSIELHQVPSGGCAINIPVAIFIGFLIGVVAMWVSLFQRRVFVGGAGYRRRQKDNIVIRAKYHRWGAPEEGIPKVIGTPPNAKAPFESEPEIMKQSFFAKTDKFEVITYLMIILFFIATFMNVTFLGSAIEKERLLATEFLAVSWLGGCGLVTRALFDYMPVRSFEGQIIKKGLTSTEYETKNVGGLFSAFGYFGIAFGIQMIISFFVIKAPLAIFDLKMQVLVMGIICAVGEELFFSYGLTGLLAQKVKWFAIPITTIIFVYYHTVVYVETANFTALIFVAIMRVVYSTVYLFSRRLSSVALAHVLNNILAGLAI